MTTRTAPTVTKRIGDYDGTTKDYPAYVIFEDGHEEYIGSRPTQHDASLLASDYIISYYETHNTPEVAAQLVMAEAIAEGRHEQLAQDMGAVWSEDAADAAYDYGKAAFSRGVSCAPVLDLAFQALDPAVGYANVQALEMWIRGWTEANLAAPMDLCPGLEYPCGKPAPHAYHAATGGDMETARSVTLWYCDACYAEMTEPFRAEVDGGATTTSTIDLPVCAECDRVGLERLRAAIFGDSPELAGPPLAAPDAYQAFVAADEAWSAELERQFGGKAGDVRYTKEGRTGPALAPLYAEFRCTCEAWHASEEQPPATPAMAREN